MIGRLSALIAGLAAALVQAAFIGSLPLPFGGIDLTIIVVTLFVGAFQFDRALIAAAAAGLTLDLLTGTPAGIRGAIMILSAGAVIIIFTRILTNVSISSFIVLNVAAYLIIVASTRLAIAATDALSGVDGHGMGTVTWAGLLAGLAAHCVVAAGMLVLFDRARHRLSRRFLLIGYGRRQA